MAAEAEERAVRLRERRMTSMMREMMLFITSPGGGSGVAFQDCRVQGQVSKGKQAFE
jgi:hypothetical protein